MKIPNRHKRSNLLLFTSLSIVSLVATISVAYYFLNVHTSVMLIFFLLIVYTICIAWYISEIQDSSIYISEIGIRKKFLIFSKFIPWKEARILYKKGSVIVKSKGIEITAIPTFFNKDEFWTFFEKLTSVLFEKEVETFRRQTKNVRLSYSISFKDLIECVNDRYLHFLRIPICILCIFSFALIFCFIVDRDIFNYVLKFIEINSKLFEFAAAAFFVFLIYRIRKFSAKNASIPDIDEGGVSDVDMSISRLGVLYRHGCGVDIYYWDEVSKIHNLPRYMILFLTPGAAIIIPKSVFPSRRRAFFFRKRTIAFRRDFLRKERLASYKLS